MTLSISDTQHSNALPYAYCSTTESHVLFTIMLSAIRLNVIMLNVVMFSVIMLIEPTNNAVNYNQICFIRLGQGVNNTGWG